MTHIKLAAYCSLLSNEAKTQLLLRLAFCE